MVDDKRLVLEVVPLEAAGAEIQGGIGTAVVEKTDIISISYTGTDPQWDMLRNSHFVDATVDLFARHGSQQWTRMGEFPIARQIVER